MRVVELPVCVSVHDVQAQLGCSRAWAYKHLRLAAGRAPGVKGLLRVARETWERYREEVQRCGSGFIDEARSGGVGSSMRTEKRATQGIRLNPRS